MTEKTAVLNEEAIDQLNEEAWGVNRTDPKLCFELATKALEVSRENHYDKGKTHALAALGACLVWLSNYDEALTHLFEARKMLRKEGNKVKEAEVVYQIFCSFYFLADYDKALEYAHEILELADINKDQNAKANAYNGIGTIYYTIGESRKAIDYLTKGLAIASMQNDKHLLARILDGLGTANHYEKNYAEAIEFKQRSLEAARASGIKNVEGYALTGLAKIYVDKGELSLAEELLHQSLAIRKEIEFKPGIAETLYSLGSIALTQKNYEAAQKYLHQGLDICLEVDSKENKYKIHEALYQLYESLNDAENFKKHFKEYFVAKEEYAAEQHRQKLKSSQMQMRMTQMEKEKELLEHKHQELEAYSRDLLLLSDLGKKITSLLTVQAVNKNVYEILHTMMDADGFGIGLVVEEKNALLFPGYIEAGEVDEESYDDLSEDDCRLSSFCFNNDREIVINDFDAEHTLYIKKRVKPNSGKDVNSLIYLPLKSDKKILGVLTVQSFKKNAYTEHHLNILKNLAVYCVIAIQNASMYEQLEEKVAERTREVTQAYETTRLLSDIGQKLTSSTEFHPIFRHLYENVNQLMDAAAFGVRIYMPERNEIEYRFEIEKGKEFDTKPVVSMDNDNNYSVWCVKNKEVIFINDNVAEHKKWVKQIHVVKGDMPHSLIFYPMMIGDRVIGVITVQSFQKFAYTAAHAEILKTLASYAAIALENANLIENLEVRVNERTAEVEKTSRDTKLISEIGKEIASTLDVQQIVAKVYERIGSLMDASAFGIGIYRPDKNDLFHTGVMENGTKLPDFAFSLDQDRVAITCFKQTREIIINNWNEEYKQYVKTDSKAVAGEDPVSMIYMPLVSKGKTIGVMSVQSFNTNAYNTYHQDIVRSLSLYIATALDNASLYHNMEERVKERTAEIEKAYQNTGLLSKISKDIFSSLSIETINEKVYENVNSLMDATVFGIGILNPATGRIHMPGLIEKGERFEVSYDVDDDRLASWCFRNQQEIFINDYAVEYKKYIKGIQSPVSGVDSSSIIYLPLYLKEKITGVITVQSFTPNVYTQYHLDILRNLAQVVASAIENARLYENMEEKVRERTAEVVQQKEQIEKTFNNTRLISEMGKEISTLLSVSEIISRVYKNVNSIMDATVFGIGLYREEHQDLFFSGVMEKDEKLPDYQFAVSEEKIATICFKKSKEIIINDWHKEFTNYVKEDYDAMEGEMPESMIYLPLLSKGKTIGVITVQSFGRNTYSDYHTDILRSLSVYIGSAIENANLYQGLEERVKERTAEIEKAYQDTKLIGQISKEISSQLTVEKILESVYSNVNSLMDAACFGIGIYHPETHTISFPGFIEKGERLDNVVFNADDDRLACWSFSNKAEIFTNDYTRDFNKYVKVMKKTLAGNPARSIIYIPLYSKGDIIGVMTSQSYDADKYTEYHMDILRGLSHSIATAIENAMLYGSLEEKVKARTAEVVKQKEIIEEKNKHITDSIVYAKRIQQAILPAEEVFSSYLQNSFVLYKPKDIVSGDFYWIERKGSKILFAVVDCTGHGVPGAFMSIIGFNGLNQVVNEYNITNPAEILNQLNKIITNSLRQKQDEAKIRDGMDISICCVDLENNKMEFAGANNPIFIVRNNNVIEITADKHPIGNFIGENEFRFTNHVLDLFPNDRVYLSSDGYADQFGGPRGKKLKYTQFRDLLLENHDKPMKEQKLLLDKMFEHWRGELEQIDDVCVIGVGI